MGYLYILYSKSTDKYYIGSTDDFTRRLSEHQRGHTKSTAHGVPWEPRLVQLFPDASLAGEAEKRLKRWKNRKIIEHIIADGYFNSGGKAHI